MYLEKIIALRDIDSKYGELFKKEAEKDDRNVLINEICNGYKNPFLVSKIILSRVNVLDNKE